LDDNRALLTIKAVSNYGERHLEFSALTGRPSVDSIVSIETFSGATERDGDGHSSLCYFISSRLFHFLPTYKMERGLPKASSFPAQLIFAFDVTDFSNDFQVGGVAENPAGNLSGPPPTFSRITTSLLPPSLLPPDSFSPGLSIQLPQLIANQPEN